MRAFIREYALAPYAVTLRVDALYLPKEQRHEA